ncbi:MAG: tRNA (5-methylaminomethyl-2-thiouridine)(34)-methyltransferase MnmD [Paludibacter sp.]|nr:tRNA (5-methylaminomethyl-2-thiouridine)(34)-methyltransferase MnmD [Paludibacter sp.]
MNTELILTEDGSHTLYVPQIDENYHSSHGAIQESTHIFIEAGLKKCSKSKIKVLEVGFGTGLNAFMALIEAEKSGKHVQYTSLEKYPVEVEKAMQLNYSEILSPANRSVFELIHTSPWNMDVEITPYFTLKKIETDFSSYVTEGKFDVIFFDAFSPEKQPEMWTQERFEMIYKYCNLEAILTTYCAKGTVRRAMQTAGFTVERLAGPLGKREILRGISQ